MTLTSPAVARIRVAMEATWLAAAGLVPLAIAPEGALLDFVQVPKAALLRTCALLLLALWAWEWALDRPASPTAAERPGLSRGPFPWIRGAAVAILAATALSAALSPVWRVAVWGRVPGSDGYGLYTALSYLVVFLAVAAHLRRPEQLHRLLAVIAASAVVASAYGVGQHFGFDPVVPARETSRRVSATFGNPIMLGAFLVMALPITIAVTLPLGGKLHPLAGGLLATLAVGLEVTAAVFTLSRGPWIGAAAGLALFAAIAWVALGWRMVAKAVAVTALAVLIATLVTLVPAARRETSPPGLELVATRVSSIPRQLAGGGLSRRAEIWRASAIVATEHPWVEGAPSPEVPGLVAGPLRPLVGFGPDMFGSVFPLSGASSDVGLPDTAHNALVNVWVELGTLGLFAHLALWLLLAWAGLAFLGRARRGAYPVAQSLAMVAVLAAIGGRFVEQLVGLPQAGDLTVFWALAAAVAAFPFLELPPAPPSVAGSEGPGSRRGSGAARARTALACVASVALAGVLWQTEGRYLAGAAVGAGAKGPFDRGDYPTTIKRLERASDLAPGVQSYHLALAAVLDARARQGDQDGVWLRRSYAEARKALDWNPMDQRTWAAVGDSGRRVARLEKGARGEVVEAQRTLAALLPGHWAVHNALAALLLEAGQPEEALAPLRRSLSLTGGDADSAQALFLSGVAFRDLREPRSGIAALEAFLRISPGGILASQAHSLLAEMYQGLGELERAREHRARAGASAPPR